MNTSRIKKMALACAFTLAALSGLHAAIRNWNWTAGSTNWSVAGNWSGSTAPGATDNTVFGDTAAVTVFTITNNAVDSSFSGQIATLQYSNVTSDIQSTLIASGVTLNVFGPADTAGDVFTVGSEISSPAGVGTAVISGSGAALVVSNTAGNIIISQDNATATGSKSTLIMTNLDTFTAYANRIGIGVDGKYNWLNNNAGLYGNGVVYLARTNQISTFFTGGVGSGTPSTGYTNWTTLNGTAGTEIEEDIEIGNGADNNASSTSSFLYLGQTNAFFIDSIGVGKSKSSSAAASMLFNPVFASPVAYFRGTNGTSSRVSFWSVGDNGTAGSTSSGAAGTNDFSLGTVDLKADVMMLGIDKHGQTSATTPAKGTFIFGSGTVDVNSLTLGAQESTLTGNLGPADGIMIVNGASATLKVNNTLELGHNALTAGSGLTSYGQLSITNGTADLNTVIVGANTTSNAMYLTNASLYVTNTLATNAAGLFVFNITNSLMGLNVPANASVRALVQTLNTGGTSNLIQFLSVPIFNTYPTQFTLVKYTTLNGQYNFALTNTPADAPGATLVNNTGNKSIDLSLPADPRPIITVQPTTAISTNPSSSITLSVTAVGVAPLSYQWYDGATALANAANASGSTNYNVTTSSLTISNLQVADSGNYTVVVTNVYGTNTSTPPSVLTVSASDIAPSITGASTQTTTNGVTTIIQDSVAGSPAPTLQWQFNGVNLTNGPGPSNLSTISGVTSSTLTIANPQYSADQGTYSLIASNTTNGVPVSVTNATALTIWVAPTISAQPSSLVVTNGNSASFSVTASGVPSPTYQWYANGVPISSGINPTAITSSLVFSSAAPSNTASYYVVVQNGAGSVTSSTVTLTVNSTMNAVTLAPANGATGLCYDTPLAITFDRAPSLNTTGKIRIYNSSNTNTPVDTLDLSLGSPQARTIGGVSIVAYPVIISGNTANIYPHSGVMTSNNTYYVTVDNGAFTDSAGAFFAGITTSNIWTFSTKAGGPVNATNFVVAANGTRDFCTVQGACDAVPSGNSSRLLINIQNGTYTEIVRLNSKSDVTFIGQNRTNTLIQYANWNGINGSSSTRPLFGVLGANDVAIENLTISNSTPNASGNNQAEALYLNSAKRFIMLYCNLDSYQDTLLVNASGDTAYVQDSHVQGNTDFMWGEGTLYATNDELMCMPFQSAQDYMTQVRTLQFTNGFAYIGCRIIGANSGVTNCYLGRDASGSGFPYGNCAYISCTMDTNVIVPVGWALGSSTVLGSGATGTSNLRLWEYQSVDLNNNPVNTSARASWSQQIDSVTAANVANVTNWLYNWQPQLAPYIVTQPVNQTAAGGQTATFSVNAIGVPAPAYQWQTNGVNILNATNASVSVSNVSLSMDGTAFTVIVTNVSGVVTSSVANLSYTQPAAGAATFTRAPGVSLKIAVVDLLTNVNDPGVTLTLAGVGTDGYDLTTTNGVTLTTNSTFIYYTGSTPGNVNDSFEYVVADGFGGLSTNTVTVDVIAVSGQLTSTPVILTSSNATLLFYGVPGTNYDVERATNLTPPVTWVDLGTTNAPAGGVFQVIDNFTDLNSNAPPQAYWQLIINP